jgi:hypothetical protein
MAKKRAPREPTDGADHSNSSARGDGGRRAQRAGRKGKPSNEAGEETRTQDATNQDERNNPVRVRLASNGWWRGEADWRP